MASPLLEALLEDSARNEQGASTARPQSHALDALLRNGLPRARDEAWKYTSLRALEQRRLANGDPLAATRTLDSAAWRLPGIEGARVVFVNGMYRADLSRLPAQAGITLVCAGNPDAPLADMETQGADARAEAFVRLNAALARHALRLDVAPGVVLDEPLHLVYASAAGEHDLAWQLRAQIHLGAGASIRLIEHHVGANPNAHLGNIVAQVALAPRARLDLMQIQNASPATTLIRRSDFDLADEARLQLTTLEVGAQMMRHDLNISLTGRAAQLVSRGVFTLRGRQHADTHLRVDHAARDTHSDCTWRGVCDERARGVFHGAITVAEGADGADAKLTNKNLLLSAQAEIDTQPALEIYADEVKAAHGATVGELDERALFYLRSRGIALEGARALLVAAFCNAMLADVSAPLREHLESLLGARLPQAEA